VHTWNGVCRIVRNSESCQSLSPPGIKHTHIRPRCKALRKFLQRNIEDKPIEEILGCEPTAPRKVSPLQLIGKSGYAAKVIARALGADKSLRLATAGDGVAGTLLGVIPVLRESKQGCDSSTRLTLEPIVGSIDSRQPRHGVAENGTRQLSYRTAQIKKRLLVSTVVKGSGSFTGSTLKPAKHREDCSSTLDQSRGLVAHNHSSPAVSAHPSG